MARTILALWTRPLDGVDRFGRINVAHRVRAALEQFGDVHHERHYNAMEHKSRIRACIAAAGALFFGVLTGRLLPLQCALFALTRDGRALADKAAAFDVVYADGIRTLLWLRRLRRIAPQVRLIVDLDDLMSLRYQQLLKRRLPLTLGYVERYFPRPVLRVLRSPYLARLTLGYEAMALHRAEQEILMLADAVVLLNGHEAGELERVGKSLGRRLRATIRTIPPCVQMPAGHRGAGGAGWRAVFVGSDVLTPNRLSIEYLLDLWHRRQIRTSLVIYGRQTRRHEAICNVRFAGYVDDIAEAYAPGTILVCPAFFRGGIKTKVLEGFAHGVPVIGNAATFEGMQLNDYPLCINEETRLVALLQEPARQAQDLECARRMAFGYLAQEHSAPRFLARWRAAIGPDQLAA